MIFVNSNAVSMPKRRNKKRELQTLCVLGLMCLALFVLSGCATGSYENPAPRSTLEESRDGGGGGGGGGGGY